MTQICKLLNLNYHINFIVKFHLYSFINKNNSSCLIVQDKILTDIGNNTKIHHTQEIRSFDSSPLRTVSISMKILKMKLKNA